MMVSPVHVLPRRGPPDGRRPGRHPGRPGWPCRPAATRTCPTSAIFASPERRLVFDINDFDETLPGPWEWDVKRLAASLEVAGRAQRPRRASSAASSSRAAVARYREAMRQFAGMTNLDVWYARVDVDELQTQLGLRSSVPASASWWTKGLAKARTRDSMEQLAKLTRMVDGRAADHLRPAAARPDRRAASRRGPKRQVIEQAHHRPDRQATSAPSRPTASTCWSSTSSSTWPARWSGVGSVGTRCWIVLMLGRDDSDPLFLQVKEAQATRCSAVRRAPAEFANQGQRVVAGQRLMQAASDIFLGWQRTGGLDGQPRDFYVRQLRDWKCSFDIESLRPEGLRLYGELCGWTLARAHARSGDRIAIAAYLGGSDVFDQAIAQFAAGLRRPERARPPGPGRGRGVRAADGRAGPVSEQGR